MVAKAKKRNLIWDNYKGILIFLVVFAHFLFAHASAYPNTFTNKLFTFIYMFHMPAFIFCSGYFSISKDSNSKNSIVRLLLYYLIFNTLMMLYLYFFDDSDLMFMSPYNSYWYLLSLIIWRLSIKYLHNIKRILPISILIALLIGYYPDFENILSIRRTIVFFPFFLMGYRMAKDEIFIKLNNIIKSNNVNKKIKIISLALIAIFSIIVYIIINNHEITCTMLLMGPYSSYREVCSRILILAVAFVMMILLLLVCPNRNIPIISKAGKNSLAIYVLHRFITLIFLKIYTIDSYSKMFNIYALILSVIVVVIFSNDEFNNWLNNKIKYLADHIVNQDKNGKVAEVVIVAVFIVILILKPATHFIETRFGEVTNDVNTSEVLKKETKNKINSAVKITYVGDLILLKDQIRSAYDLKHDKYDFNGMFKYSKKYLSDSDLTIGVLGGPTAGNNNPITSGNLSEKGNVIVNLPDSYINAIKNSGIDLINTASSHMYDYGYEGVVRTLDTLDKNGLQHVGTYRDEKSRQEILVVEVNGIKIAVLSYLSNIAGNKTSEVYKEYPYVTSIIPRTTSSIYPKLYKTVKEDFKRAKELKPDLILVMNHTGRDYTHENSDFHDKWNQIFASFGADIIIGNTSNSVNDIEYKDNAIIINSAGNFINSYQEYDGDASSIVNIYIDKTTKKAFATDVIPVYSHELKEDYYTALPIYEVMNNKEIYQNISKYELKHIEEVQKLITKTMIKNEINLNEIEKRYYFINNKYYVENEFKQVAKAHKKKQLYKWLEAADSVTFIGDSITYGGKNNYYPYYVPLMNYFKGRDVNDLAKNGFTTKMVMHQYKNEIINSKSDVYIIALGINDIRFRNSKICAMTAKEYVEKMDGIIQIIRKSNSKGKIVLIPPWTSLGGDKLTILSDEQKKRLVDEYTTALKEYSAKNNYLYINPNPYIENIIKNNKEKYMEDYIHPNNNYGIRLYSEAILHESK